MKQILSIAATVFCAINTFAQNDSIPAYSITEALQATEGVTIEQPEALSQRLVKNTAATETAHQSNKVSGFYRIEVYADNTKQAKTQATARHRNMQSRFPQYPSVLVFESPFWRVKVGAFSNRSDAEAAMTEIKKVFPAYAPYLRIVRN